ncbi:MAG: EamA family transporter [Deltaproteobacteria bacterium]|nr:EamA family transporter [Deltaproteobacteria bacterium]
MYWLPIALLTALALSTADALSKRALNDKTDDLVIVWVRQGYALPFLFLAFLFVEVPTLDRAFWMSVAALIPLEIIALMLYIKAIRLSPLSLSIPFLALSPVFIIFTAFLFLGEWPSIYGLIGIILITFGAYMLNAASSEKGLLGPLKAITKEPGSMLMIAVAFIYSITSTLGKIAIQHSSPIFFGSFYPFLLTIVLTVMIISKGRLPLVFSKPGQFLLIGFCIAAMILSHFIALSLTNVAYMISVKRTSLIFSVIYGKILFNEVNIRERLLGSVIMVAGVVLIALF